MSKNSKTYYGFLSFMFKNYVNNLCLKLKNLCLKCMLRVYFKKLRIYVKKHMKKFGQTCVNTFA